jgi:hypothetical protein
MPLFGPKVEPFNAVKLKANLKMAVTRIRMIQNKRVNSVKIQRRQLAELLNIGKLDSCRIRVEGLIREDLSIEGLELLTLFTELVASRIQVIIDSKQCPTDLKESLTSMIWASARIGDDIAEFNVVKEQIGIKYGKPFVEMAVANSELSVNQKVMDKLNVMVPNGAACLEYIRAIAAEFNVPLDEEALVATSNIVPTTIETECDSAMTHMTASGSIAVPPIIVPRDELEARLLALKRQ